MKWNASLKPNKKDASEIFETTPQTGSSNTKATDSIKVIEAYVYIYKGHQLTVEQVQHHIK